MCKNTISINDNNFLTIFSQNIRSMNKNLDSFLSMFDHNNMPDVFIFTETWHDLDTLVSIPGYRDVHTIRHGRSGGVSIFVKGMLSSSLIDEFSFANTSIEICTIKITNSNQHVYLSGVYRPFSDNIDNFNSAIENIISNNMFASSPSVFAGDFNINTMCEGGDWGCR